MLIKPPTNPRTLAILKRRGVPAMTMRHAFLHLEQQVKDIPTKRGPVGVKRQLQEFVRMTKNVGEEPYLYVISGATLSDNAAAVALAIMSLTVQHTTLSTKMPYWHQILQRHGSRCTAATGFYYR